MTTKKEVNERVVCDTQCILKEIIYFTRVNRIELRFTKSFLQVNQ
jgi:hypothetical protein